VLCVLLLKCLLFGERNLLWVSVGVLHFWNTRKLFFVLCPYILQLFNSFDTSIVILKSNFVKFLGSSFPLSSGGNESYSDATSN